MFVNITVNREKANENEYAVKTGRLSHALILDGGDEKIRALAAREIAKAIVCKGENKPCGICPSCKKAESGNHPDIHFLKKQESSSLIKVDEVRSLREKARLLPNDSDKSVFIIEEAQLMGVQAQNALLKIFEEPAAHVCFILTCDSKSSLLETIISRAASYYLSSEIGENGDDDESKAFAAELAVIFCEKSELDFLRKTAEFQKNKTLFKDALTALIAIFRDALVVGNADIQLISGKKDAAKKLSDYFTKQKLIACIRHIQRTLDALDASANYNLLITRFCSMLYEIKEALI